MQFQILNESSHLNLISNLDCIMSSTTTSKAKFPKFLVKENEQNIIGHHIMISIIRFSSQEGGYTACFGHRKKNLFLKKALWVLFDEHGVLNELVMCFVVNVRLYNTYNTFVFVVSKHLLLKTSL